MKADREKTIAQMYLDPASFMRAAGSEVLYGEDWKRRKVELRERCNGKCEYYRDSTGLFEQCQVEAADPHHVIPRSKGRDDRLSNLQALCRFHHDLLDKRKPRWSKTVSRGQSSLPLERLTPQRR